MNTNEINYSLLTVIVTRGKGSSVLKFAREKGASDASCLLGQGTINNKILQFIQMDDVDKEIILVIVPADRETEILNQLNIKFHFEKKNHGIAFTMPLAGIMKMKKDSSAKWQIGCLTQDTLYDYLMMLTIVEKGKAANIIKTSQSAGYYGGTIIKARSSRSQSTESHETIFIPEKEVVLMVVESKKATELESILRQMLSPNQQILKIGVSSTVGLFQNEALKEANLNG